MSGSEELVVDYQKFYLPTLPIKMWAGGLGCEINAATTTASVTLVGTSQNVACIVNEGTVAAHFRLGGSNVVATTACKAIAPGVEMLVYLERGQTYIAAITRSGTAWLQITLGYGE